ncbi:MAG: endolytic transglycosylase MltG [Patescibacteria group bacterium]|nr:endolytic transglycosylase MltG [Patescibacteria group bacterium]
MLKKLIFLGLILLIILFLTTIGWYQWVIKPINPKITSTQVFVIPKGQATSNIAKRLKQAKLIKSDLAFKLFVDQKNYSNKLQAGDFQLSPSMDLETIIESLTHGSLDFWITFPEGLRVEQIAERLQEKTTNFTKNDFIIQAKPYEGHLFPDTYLIPQTASIQDVIDLLLKTFNQKSPTQDKNTIILASLIEREAKHQKDKSLVSSVIHNRLDINMALQIDATVQYILGKEGGWWPNNLTLKDLKTPSPYNTYQNSSLPPAPISNPGLETLKAATAPANTNYLYYVSDSGGYNHYAKDLAGHNANIKKYLSP